MDLDSLAQELLELYNFPIGVVLETTFLGLLFDVKLAFLPHINILRFLSGTDGCEWHGYIRFM